METVSIWAVGYVCTVISLTVLAQLLSPLMEYSGDNAFMIRFVEVLDETFQLVSSVMFLSLPVAATYGVFLVGQWLVSLAA